MNIRNRRLLLEEHARKGNEIYDTQLRSQLEPAHVGDIVAIDIDTGNFEMAKTALKAATKLRARTPQAQIWCVRVGSPAVYHIG